MLNRLRIGINHLASLKLTALLLLLLIPAIYLSYQLEYVQQLKGSALRILLPLLSLLVLNLIAAILTNPRFRRQPPLLIFHLALLALVLLLAVAKLSYLKGRVGIVEGAGFDGQLHAFEAGPLHPWHLDQVRFVNEGFEIEYGIGSQYSPGPKRSHTFNRVSWVDDSGTVHRTLIGDQKPLILDNYRFYTSFNKGFAITLVWEPNNADAQAGYIHLPPYPGNEYSQTQEWTLPGTEKKLWMLLAFDEVILDPDKPSRFRPPSEHRLVLRYDDQRVELQVGESMRLPEGRIHYLGLKSWMGYRVDYDPTRPWLLAACLLAVLSITWFFLNKFRRTPWDRSSAE